MRVYLCVINMCVYVFVCVFVCVCDGVMVCVSVVCKICDCVCARVWKAKCKYFESDVKK